MKLVTILIDWSKLSPEYVPGRCNIGRRGRAMRLATGVVLIAISIILGILVLDPVNRWLSLVLVFPAYVGLLACLESSMSFCVLHAARGTYDLNEARGSRQGRRTLCRMLALKIGRGLTVERR